MEERDEGREGGGRKEEREEVGGKRGRRKEGNEGGGRREEREEVGEKRGKR